MPRLSLALVTVLAALALGGCLRFDSDLTLSQDDTVTGRFIVAVEEGQGERLGTDDRTMSEDIWSDYPSAATLADATIRDYSGDGFVGIEVSFADEPLASFAPTAESWGITRVGDEFIVSGPSNSTSATEDSTTPSARGPSRVTCRSSTTHTLPCRSRSQETSPHRMGRSQARR